MRSRSIVSSALEDNGEDPKSCKKVLQHGFTWHTTTDRTSEESSCSSYGSFGGDDDNDVNVLAGFKQKRPRKPIKRVAFCATAANEIHEIESLLDHPELWWDGEELMEIRGDCNVILRQQRRNHELVESVTSILAQGMTENHDPEQTKKFMAAMKAAQDARGLERDAVPPCAKLIQAHYKSVFDMQKKLRDKQLLGSDRGTEALAKVCEKSSRAFALLASRMAQHDIRQAMAAAFTFTAGTGAMVKGKENRQSRRNSVSGTVNKSAKFTMTKVNRRVSLTSSTSEHGLQDGGGDRRNAMAKRAGGFDRRKMLAHSTSMRAVTAKYGSLGF